MLLPLFFFGNFAFMFSSIDMPKVEADAFK